MKTLGLIILIAIPWTLCSQTPCDVKVYLDLSGKPQIGSELDPARTSLDSLLIEPNDVVQIDEKTFTITLTKNAAERLRKTDLDFKCFTLLINDQPVLAGWFWGCHTSLGTEGYIIFNLDCGEEEQNELRIDYSLPRQAYPDKEILKDLCQ